MRILNPEPGEVVDSSFNLLGVTQITFAVTGGFVGVAAWKILGLPVGGQPQTTPTGGSNDWKECETLVEPEGHIGETGALKILVSVLNGKVLFRPKKSKPTIDIYTN